MTIYKALGTVIGKKFFFVFFILKSKQSENTLGYRKVVVPFFSSLNPNIAYGDSKPFSSTPHK